MATKSIRPPISLGIIPLLLLPLFPTEMSGKRIKLAEGELPERELVQLPVSFFPEPRCTYQVRFGGEEGMLVNRQVSIGETLVHMWGCAYQQQNGPMEGGRRPNGGKADSVYCMMVHNCTGEGIGRQQTQIESPFPEPVEIIDEFGCSAWPGILPQIQYQGDLRAKMDVQTFALDFDQPAIFFKCNIRLLLKINGRCRRPHCGQQNEADQQGFRPPNSPLNFP